MHTGDRSFGLGLKILCCDTKIVTLADIYSPNCNAVGLPLWYLQTLLPVESMSITNKVVNSNPAHGEVYSIQHYVIKSSRDLLQVGGFLRVLRFPPPITLTAML